MNEAAQVARVRSLRSAIRACARQPAERYPFELPTGEGKQVGLPNIGKLPHRLVEQQIAGQPNLLAGPLELPKITKRRVVH